MRGNLRGDSLFFWEIRKYKIKMFTRKKQLYFIETHGKIFIW